MKDVGGHLPVFVYSSTFLLRHFSWRSTFLLLLLYGLEALVDFFPVHDVPPGLQILGTAIVVFQIVGVLPNVVAHDGVQALRDGTVLVGSGDNFHFALIVGGEPDPSTAELARTGGIELFLKLLKSPNVFLMTSPTGPAGSPPPSRFHDAPEHGVVHVAAAVVADGIANVFGNRIQVAQEIFRRFLEEGQDAYRARHSDS